jgi:hypothetical protein
VLADDIALKGELQLDAMYHAVMTGKQEAWCRCIMRW